MSHAAILATARPVPKARRAGLICHYQVTYT
jgi:hypothetical protein